MSINLYFLKDLVKINETVPRREHFRYRIFKGFNFLGGILKNKILYISNKMYI